MNRTADEREKRLAQLKAEVSRRSFDRHASLLKDVAELPAEFQTSVVTELAAHENLSPIILFPPQIQRGWDYVPKQALLFTQTGFIHLFSSIWPDEEPQLTCFRAGDLLYMESSLLLLYGYLDVIAQGQGSPVRIGVEFNTVAWPLLWSPLRKLLQVNKADCSEAMQRALEHLPIKFANGAKLYGLLPGEQLVELVFQPAMWKRWLRFFRRQLIANTLLLLTSNYVVVIREALNVSQGWILTYIPRQCISEMQNRPGELWNELVFRLKHRDQAAEYKLRLADQTIEAWHLRWARHGDQWKDFAISP